jgi:pantoate--beta-alanine ligase
MVHDLAIPVEIVPCPTVRDADGLALSSRNSYLGRDDRERSLALSRALSKITELVEHGERDASLLLGAGRAVLEDASLDAIDYLEIVDPSTLEAADRVDAGVLVCGAVRVGTTRLIDNVTIEPEASQ